MNDKKNWIIIILSIIIIILVWLIFSGNGKAQIALSEIREQYSILIRSTGIVESELTKSVNYNTQLETDNLQLRNDNTELGQIIDDLTTGSKKTKNYLVEYGTINYDFANFIKSNQPIE